MINWRIIARIFSLLLILEGLFMLPGAAVSYIFHESPSPYIYSSLITLITGVFVFTPLRNEEKITGKKEGYIIVSGAWILIALFGTLPYLFTGSVKNFADAFFESMSGFTTTGATIFSDVESLPHGLLFWRSLTQWFGGMGIILISLYILPVFRSIYIQLPASEFAGQPSDKIHPRIMDVSKRLISIYAIITLGEALMLVIGGMPAFDALCISFSTLSTGGFTTMNNGISEFANSYILIIITIFMFIAGMNMTLIYFGLKGNFRKILNNEFIFYSVICLVFIMIVSTVLSSRPEINAGKAILEGSFHVISIITTTGFYISDHQLWGDLIIILFFVLMFTGGTAGSTSGGIKIVRLLLITKNSRKELTRLIHPNAFIPVRMDRKVISQTTLFNLLIFITLYFLIICISSLILAFMDYDLITSFSTSTSMLANIGPGLGRFGPFTNFSQAPYTGKWFMCGLMLFGRLELLTVMVLFTRGFYTK
ncbi:MAG TPA: TrkH family potassium uptake protein [Bacteroidales bacterium]|nr:TrkH family potassium uptake protein [Bacteroidales bacterium]